MRQLELDLLVLGAGRGKAQHRRERRNGRLMAQVTAAQIIAEQDLKTWTVVGGDLAALTDSLRGQPGVDQAAVFGNALHVTGKDGGALEATLRRAAASAHHQIAPATVGLEDVFIHLMARSQDNFGAAP